jgi:hypothetical protein
MHVLLLRQRRLGVPAPLVFRLVPPHLRMSQDEFELDEVPVLWGDGE